VADDMRKEIQADLPEEVELLLLLERLKNLERRNPLASDARRERVGEHSWYVALGVILLADYAPEPIDIAKAALLAIAHDTVEAFVGDTFAFGPDVFSQESREHEAMKQLEESSESPAIHRLVDLWQECEAQQTQEARFVKGIDAFLPIVLNYMNVEHSSWNEHNVHSDQVRKRLGCVRDAIGSLAMINDRMIDQARAEGYLE
jgi:putative hydrolase of HD superfamily